MCPSPDPILFLFLQQLYFTRRESTQTQRGQQETNLSKIRLSTNLIEPQLQSNVVSLRFLPFISLNFKPNMRFLLQKFHLDILLSNSSYILVRLQSFDDLFFGWGCFLSLWWIQRFAFLLLIEPVYSALILCFSKRKCFAERGRKIFRNFGWFISRRSVSVEERRNLSGTCDIVPIGVQPRRQKTRRWRRS